jgi:hypothetical protein
MFFVMFNRIITLRIVSLLTTKSGGDVFIWTNSTGMASKLAHTAVRHLKEIRSEIFLKKALFWPLKTSSMGRTSNEAGAVCRFCRRHLLTGKLTSPCVTFDFLESAEHTTLSSEHSL